MKDDNDLLIGIAVFITVFLFLGMFGFGGMVGCGYDAMGNWGYSLDGTWIFWSLFKVLILVALLLFILWLIKQLQNDNNKRK